MELGERKRRVLAEIIEQYIETGEPVGSKAVCLRLDNVVSSATVRNDMAELEELGYLAQPHTSAGRVPTHLGYRYYVDRLMKPKKVTNNDKAKIEEVNNVDKGDPGRILERASSVLADITNCASLSTTPADKSSFIRRIEFVQLSSRTAMIVLLTSTGILKSRACRTDVAITPAIVEYFYSITNRVFIGRSLSDIDAVMLQDLFAYLGDMAVAVLPFFTTIANLAHEAAQTEIIVQGQSNLLNHKELQHAFELIEFLRRSKPIEHLLSSNTSDLYIVIGHENVYREMEDSTMIISRYNVDGRHSGSIGIVGPTRLDYGRLIPNIRYLNSLVSKLLSESFEDL